MSSASIRRSSDQGSHPQRGYPSIAITRVGPFPPRMSNVGVVIDLRYTISIDPLVHRFRHCRGVQPQLSSAVAEREDITLLQFRTASGVLAHINTNWLTPIKARNVTVATRGKYVMGDLLTRQVTGMFRLPAGRQLFDAAPVGRSCRAVARRTAGVPARRSARARPPAVTGEECRCQPRDRRAVSGRATGHRFAPAKRKAPSWSHG